MKNAIIMLLTVVLLLVSCSDNGKSHPDPVDQSQEQQDHQNPQSPQITQREFTFTRENFPRMDGSTSTAPLAQAAAAILLGEHRDDVFMLSADFSRTTQSFRNLAEGLCDILIVSEPAPEVFNELRAMSFEIEMAPIAIDALIFIVNASNPVDNLTHQQIKDIYTGKITNWSEVGGDNIDITPFQRNAEAGSQVLMEKLVMDGQNMTDAPSQSFFTAFGMDEMITAIKGFDGAASAIGYTVFFFAENMGTAEGLKIIAIDEITPKPETIKNGNYPFLNPYYVVIGANEPEDSPVRIMWEWFQSADGQKLVSLEGYVPIR